MALAEDMARRFVVEQQWRRLADRVDVPTRIGRALADRENRRLTGRTGELADFTESARLTPEVKRIHAMPANRARLVRILDFIAPDESIIDVGCGDGAVAGRIITSRSPRSYVAVEPSPNKTAAFREMAEENGIAPERYRLVESTIEGVDPDLLAGANPSLVLILEVLEHVHSPDRVLADVAARIGPETDVLISVPVLGCIEHEWGHIGVFDRARIERMATEAGLHIHWVEPVMNQWLFVLLSRSAAPRKRLAPIIEREMSAPLGPAAAPEEHYYFRRVDHLSTSRLALCPWAIDADRTTLIHPDGKVARIHTSAGAKATEAAFSVYAPDLDVIRLQLQVDGGAGAITHVTTHLVSGDRRIEEWKLNASEVERLGPLRTLVFRRGFDGQHTHRNPVPGAVADRCNLYFGIAPGRAATIDIRAVAYVRHIDNPSQPRRRAFMA